MTAMLANIVDFLFHLQFQPYLYSMWFYSHFSQMDIFFGTHYSNNSTQQVEFDGHNDFSEHSVRSVGWIASRAVDRCNGSLRAKWHCEDSSAISLQCCYKQTKHPTHIKGNLNVTHSATVETLRHVFTKTIQQHFDAIHVHLFLRTKIFTCIHETEHAYSK